MNVIGIDLGGTSMRAGFVKENKIVQLQISPTPANETEIVVLEAIANMIREILKENSVEAIGIGVPSIVNVEKGIVYDTMNIPSWKEVYLKDYLEGIFKIPVYVNNDANCFVAGEKCFGKGKAYHSIVGVVMGTGLGSGLILQNKLYEGTNCGAGEIGNIPYLDSNYEYYCSGQFFKSEFDVGALSAYQNAVKGKPEALAMFKIFGNHVGNLIQTIMYAYDPQLIVLGGSVSKSYHLFQEYMYRSFSKYLFPKAIQNLKIEISELENSAILGAASLCYINN